MWFPFFVQVRLCGTDVRFIGIWLLSSRRYSVLLNVVRPFQVVFQNGSILIPTLRNVVFRGIRPVNHCSLRQHVHGIFSATCDENRIGKTGVPTCIGCAPPHLKQREWIVPLNVDAERSPSLSHPFVWSKTPTLRACLSSKA